MNQMLTQRWRCSFALMTMIEFFSGSCRADVYPHFGVGTGFTSYDFVGNDAQDATLSTSSRYDFQPGMTWVSYQLPRWSVKIGSDIRYMTFNASKTGTLNRPSAVTYSMNLASSYSFSWMTVSFGPEIGKQIQFTTPYAQSTKGQVNLIYQHNLKLGLSMPVISADGRVLRLSAAGTYFPASAQIQNGFGGEINADLKFLSANRFTISTGVSTQYQRMLLGTQRSGDLRVGIRFSFPGSDDALLELDDLKLL